MILRLNADAAVDWQTGLVTMKNPRAGFVAEVHGDKTYLVKDSSMTPGARATDLRVGDRVRFEDRCGYVVDLRRIRNALDGERVAR